MTRFGTGPPAAVVVVPHTHWDREWYASEASFRLRLVPMMERVLDQLEAGTLPVFLLDGQTILVRDYLSVRPDDEPRVRRLARDGKLLVGPWFVQSDELLPAGETLVRNLLCGREDGARFGAWLPLGYSPDAFGHAAALPTVLAGFGVAHAVVWRGYGGEPGEESDLFRWVGPDGSEVLVHHLSPSGYELGANLPSDRAALARRWKAILAELAPRAGGRPLLLLNGADHHGPQRDLREALHGLAAMVGRQAPVIGSPLAYFAALPAGAPVPAVAGELRFSYRHAWTLQGVHGARARLKAAVREAERQLLRWAEPQAALARAQGGRDRRALLDAAWREHLENCFHDTLAGTTGDVVNAEALVRAARVVHAAQGILREAVDDRLGQDRSNALRHRERWTPTLAVCNPSAYARGGVVEATVTLFEERVVVGRAPERRQRRNGRTVAPRLVDAEGRPVPLQVLGTYEAYERMEAPDAYPLQDRVRAWRVACRVDDVPALGFRALRVVEGPGNTGKAEGQRVRVRAGEAVAEWCRVSGTGERAFQLHVQDRGITLRALGDVWSERDDGDLYTFEPALGDEPAKARWAPVRAVWRGPLVAALARDFTVPGRAEGTLYARVDAGSRLLRMSVEGENLSGGHRLRIRFPLPAPADVHLADAAYLPVSRRREDYDPRRFPREWPVQTAPMHRYVSVPDGLTVFSRDAYEYELASDGAVLVTLLRAVGQLSRDDLAARPGHAAWPVATPGAQEPGGFRAELAVSLETLDRGAAGGPPAAGAIDAARHVAVEALAEEFHAPLAGVMLRYGMRVPAVTRGPRLQGKGLAFRAAKPATRGGGIVLRSVNLTRSATQGTWVLPFRVKRACKCRLDETPLEDLTVAGGHRQVVFDAAPREVVTVVVEPSRARRP